MTMVKELSKSMTDICNSEIVALNQYAVQRTVGKKLELLCRHLRLLREGSVVVVHGYYLAMVPLVVWLASTMRRAVVIVPHGSLTMRQQKYSRRKKWLFNATAGGLIRRRIRAFVACSEAEKEDLLHFFRDAQVVIGRIGIEPTSEVSEVGRVPHQPYRILTLSRLAPKKRIDISIDVLAELTRRGVDAELVIAGDGSASYKDKLISQVKSAGLSERVDFLGWVKGAEKSNLFHSCDIFMLPSEDENFGIAPIEALAHELPTVTSNAVASSELVAGKSCIVVQSLNVEHFADSVHRILVDAEYELICRDARRIALEKLSWPNVARQWYELLLGLRG